MKRRESIGFDITPLIDIVFILFTFFLVATTIKNDKNRLDIDLPKTNSFQKYEKSKNIILKLNMSKIIFNEKEYSLTTLEDELTKIDKNNIIDIYIDKKVNYERISKLLDSLVKYKLNKISLITKK